MTDRPQRDASTASTESTASGSVGHAAPEKRRTRHGIGPSTPAGKASQGERCETSSTATPRAGTVPETPELVAGNVDGHLMNAGHMESGLVERLSEICLADRHTDASALLDRLLSQGIALREITETIVPEAARLIGDRWCADTLGFAHVTIACARLMRLVREAETRERIRSDPFGAPQILVLVMKDAQHTLGATVLTGMLRRRGIDARLIVDADPADLGAHLFTYCYDAILISATTCQSLDGLRRLVGCIAAAAPGTPVALGGTVAERAEGPEGIVRLTGAAIVTADIDAALRHCGITAMARARGTWIGQAVAKPEVVSSQPYS